MSDNIGCSYNGSFSSSSWWATTFFWWSRSLSPTTWRTWRKRGPTRGRGGDKSALAWGAVSPAVSGNFGDTGQRCINPKFFCGCALSLSVNTSSRKEGTMTNHWIKRHKLNGAKVKALQDLPPLVQLVDNRRFRDPGREVGALTPPETEPWGALGHSVKGSLWLEVDQALVAATLVPAQSSTVPAEPALLSSAVSSSEVAVDSSTAQMLLHLVPSQEGQETVFKLVPSVPEEQAPLYPTASLPLAVAQMTTQPPVISATDPDIVTITRLACPSETLSPSADATSSSPARQVFIEREPQDIRSTAATGSVHRPVVLDSSPSPELNELLPAPSISATQQGSPAQVTPHRSPAQVPQQSSPEPAAPQASPEEEAQQVSPEQVMQRVPPRNAATSSKALIAEERPPQLSSQLLRAQLRSLDISVELLQKLRREVQENVLETDKAEIAEKEAELHPLCRWVAYLENERERADWGNRENPSTVGHLQRIGSTRAYVLFPNVGQTAVYPLTAADLAMLDLKSQSEVLSYEPLWEMSILCVDSHNTDHGLWIMDLRTELSFPKWFYSVPVDNGIWTQW